MTYISKRVKSIWIWAILIIGLAGFAVFYFVPFFLGFYYSTFDVLENEFIGLTHYTALFNSELFRVAFTNTVKFTSLALCLVFIMSFSAAYILRFSVFNRFIPIGLFYLPFVVPTVSISFVWYWLFHHRGLLSNFLYSTIQVQINFFSGNLVYVPILILFLWRYAGFSILVYFMGLCTVPSEYIDAYYMESKSKIFLIWYILLPHEKPRTVYVLLLNLIFSTNIFREIYAVWANYPPRRVYMIQHFVYNNFMRLQYERAAAGGVILALFILFLLAIVLLWERRGS